MVTGVTSSAVIRFLAAKSVGWVILVTLNVCHAQMVNMGQHVNNCAQRTVLTVRMGAYVSSAR